jgi:gas vesicle protein
MASQDVREKDLVLLKTRPGVLARFFQKSRDRWKEKCKKLRQQAKSQQVRIRDLERSREAWRSRAEQHAAELRQWQQDTARRPDEQAASQQEPEQKAGRPSPRRSSPRRPCRGTSSRRSKFTLW